MANDLARMKTVVRRWIDSGTHAEGRLDDDDITGATNEIIAGLSRNDLMFNEFQENVATSSGVAYVALSSLTNKFSRPFSMWYEDSSSEWIRVTYMPPEAFEKKYVGTTTSNGEPKHYTIWDENIYFGPTPDATYTMIFRFYGYPADLATGTDTNSYLDNGWDVIKNGVLAEVCLAMIEDQRYAIFASRFEKLRRSFIIEHARARTSGARSQSREPGWLED